jgi:hypothetical protein
VLLHGRRAATAPGGEAGTHTWRTDTLTLRSWLPALTDANSTASWRHEVRAAYRRLAERHTRGEVVP